MGTAWWVTVSHHNTLVIMTQVFCCQSQNAMLTNVSSWVNVISVYDSSNIMVKVAWMANDIFNLKTSPCTTKISYDDIPCCVLFVYAIRGEGHLK